MGKKNEGNPKHSKIGRKDRQARHVNNKMCAAATTKYERNERRKRSITVTGTCGMLHWVVCTCGLTSIDLASGNTGIPMCREHWFESHQTRKSDMPTASTAFTPP